MDGWLVGPTDCDTKSVWISTVISVPVSISVQDLNTIAHHASSPCCLREQNFSIPHPSYLIRSDFSSRYYFHSFLKHFELPGLAPQLQLLHEKRNRAVI